MPNKFEQFALSTLNSHGWRFRPPIHITRLLNNCALAGAYIDFRSHPVFPFRPDGYDIALRKEVRPPLHAPLWPAGMANQSLNEYKDSLILLEIEDGHPLKRHKIEGYVRLFEWFDSTVPGWDLWLMIFDTTECPRVMCNHDLRKPKYDPANVYRYNVPESQALSFAERMRSRRW